MPRSKHLQPTSLSRLSSVGKKHPLTLTAILLLAALTKLRAADTPASATGMKPTSELQKIEISDYSPSEEIR